MPHSKSTQKVSSAENLRDVIKRFMLDRVEWEEELSSIRQVVKTVERTDDNSILGSLTLVNDYVLFAAQWIEDVGLLVNGLQVAWASQNWQQYRLKRSDLFPQRTKAEEYPVDAESFLMSTLKARTGFICPVTGIRKEEEALKSIVVRVGKVIEKVLNIIRGIDEYADEVVAAKLKRPE